MIKETLKNLIIKAKKEKVTISMYCDRCQQEQTFRGTPIRVRAMKKEFLRIHKHEVGIVKRFIKFIKRK